uniref:FERM domain-containing protein n=1 Tax=Ditylenchus dipsaci TaxID=166011 RepID=A0A915EK33_9BILA
MSTNVGSSNNAGELSLSRGAQEIEQHDLQTTTRSSRANEAPVPLPPSIDEGPSPFVQEGVARKNLQPSSVTYLDGHKYTFYTHKNADGEILFDMVANQLNLLEKDYFGLAFYDDQSVRHWLYKDKRISKQLKGLPWTFSFEVKFYSPQPSQLAEDLTRYLLCLQLRQDIYNERLPVSFVAQAKLGSLAAQSEYGDYDGMMSDELLDRIRELHKHNRGLTPPDAELAYLNECKELALYGVHLFPAKDSKGKPVQIGVSSHGLSVYNDQMRLHRFAWVNIVKFSYRRNTFTIKLKPGELEKKDTVASYKLVDYPAAKRLWKCAVEHHTFFRLIQPEGKSKGSFLSFGSNRFRYQGRTNIQSHMASQLFDSSAGPTVERVNSGRAVSKSADDIAVKASKLEHTSPLHYADDGSRDLTSSPEKSYHIISGKPLANSTAKKQPKEVGEAPAYIVACSSHSPLPTHSSYSPPPTCSSTLASSSFSSATATSTTQQHQTTTTTLHRTTAPDDANMLTVHTDNSSSYDENTLDTSYGPPEISYERIVGRNVTYERTVHQTTVNYGHGGGASMNSPSTSSYSSAIGHLLGEEPRSTTTSTHQRNSYILNDSGYCASSSAAEDSFSLPSPYSTLALQNVSYKSAQGSRTCSPYLAGSTSPYEHLGEKVLQHVRFEEEEQQPKSGDVKVVGRRRFEEKTVSPKIAKRSKPMSTGWRLFTRGSSSSTVSNKPAIAVLAPKPNLVDYSQDDELVLMKCWEVPQLQLSSRVSVYHTGIYHSPMEEEVAQKLGGTHSFGQLAVNLAKKKRRVPTSEKILRQSVGPIGYKPASCFPLKYFVGVYHSGFSVLPVGGHAYRSIPGKQEVGDPGEYGLSTLPYLATDRLEKAVEAETCALRAHCTLYRWPKYETGRGSMQVAGRLSDHPDTTESAHKPKATLHLKKFEPLELGISAHTHAIKDLGEGRPDAIQQRSFFGDQKSTGTTSTTKITTSELRFRVSETKATKEVENVSSMTTSAHEFPKREGAQMGYISSTKKVEETKQRKKVPALWHTKKPSQTETVDDAKSDFAAKVEEAEELPRIVKSTAILHPKHELVGQEQYMKPTTSWEPTERKSPPYSTNVQEIAVKTSKGKRRRQRKKANEEPEAQEEKSQTKVNKPTATIHLKEEKVVVLFESPGPAFSHIKTPEEEQQWQPQKMPEEGTLENPLTTLYLKHQETSQSESSYPAAVTKSYDGAKEESVHGVGQPSTSSPQQQISTTTTVSRRSSKSIATSQLEGILPTSIPISPHSQLQEEHKPTAILHLKSSMETSYQPAVDVHRKQPYTSKSYTKRSKDSEASALQIQSNLYHHQIGPSTSKCLPNCFHLKSSKKDEEDMSPASYGLDTSPFHGCVDALKMARGEVYWLPIKHYSTVYHSGLSVESPKKDLRWVVHNLTALGKSQQEWVGQQQPEHRQKGVAVIHLKEDVQHESVDDPRSAVHLVEKGQHKFKKAVRPMTQIKATGQKLVVGENKHEAEEQKMWIMEPLPPTTSSSIFSKELKPTGILTLKKGAKTKKTSSVATRHLAATGLEKQTSGNIPQQLTEITPQPYHPKEVSEVVINKPDAVLHLKQAQPSDSDVTVGEMVEIKTFSKKRKTRGSKSSKEVMPITETYIEEVAELSRLDDHGTQSIEGLSKQYHYIQSMSEKAVVSVKERLTTDVPSSKSSVILHLHSDVPVKEVQALGISGKKVGWRSGTGHREELAKKTEEVASPQPSKSKMGQEIVAHKPMAMLHLKSRTSSELPEAADLASLPSVAAGKKGEKKEKHGVTLDTQPYTGQLSELSRLDGHETQPWEGPVQPYHSGQSWQAVNKQVVDITIPASKTVAVLHLRQPSQPTENKESTTSSLTEVKKHVSRQMMGTQQYTGQLGEVIATKPMAVLHLKDKHPQPTPTDTRRLEQKKEFAVLQLKKDKKQVGSSQQVKGLEAQSYIYARRPRYRPQDNGHITFKVKSITKARGGA